MELKSQMIEMKKINSKQKLLLVVIVICSSCSLLKNPTVYEYRVDSYSTAVAHEKDYYLKSQMSEEPEIMLKMEVENQITSMLADLGYNRLSEFVPGSLVILYTFSGEYRTVSVDKVAPVLGVTGSNTTTSGNERYDWKGKSYEDDSRTDFNYGIVGAKRYQVDETYMAKSFQIGATYMEDENSITDVYWKTIVYTSEGGSDLRKMLSIIVNNVVPEYIDKNTNEKKIVRAEIVNGNCKIIER